MRLVERNATEVEVVEVEVRDAIFRREVTISDEGGVSQLKKTHLDQCKVATKACCMSSRRWSVVVRQGQDVVETYDVLSGVVFRGSEPIGCLPDAASSLISERLGAVGQAKVNPLDEIPIFAKAAR